MRIACVAVCVALSAASGTFAQKQNNIWHFGWSAGVDFNGPLPVSISGSRISTLEGCASVADRNTGQLLFYTDGIVVYNRAGAIMPSGFSLGGDRSSTQSSLIVPVPGDSLKYYIFTTDAKENGLAKGLRYSIVDMRAAGGMGDVVLANVELLVPAVEKITAVRKCSGDGYWVLAHGWLDNRFYAYPVTASGVGAPVISPVGMVHQPPTEDNSVGYLRASPDGKTVACAIRDMVTVQVFDFDAATGILSNPISLVSPTKGCQTYGLAFSPDNNYLYVAEYFGDVVQYDLRSRNQATIAASRVVLNGGDRSVSFGALQLGPDGKIYCAMRDQPYLGVINNPNAAGTAAGFVKNGLKIKYGTSSIGLPNMIVSDAAPSGSATAGPDRAMCAGDSVLLTASGGLAYQWSPATGLSCTNCASPMASPATATDYTVTITMPSGCIKVDTVRVTPRAPYVVRASISRDLHVRPGATVIAPILTADSNALDLIDSIVIRITYQPSMARFIRFITQTTATEGWNLHLAVDSVGLVVVRLTRPPGGVNRPSDTLLMAEFGGFVGDTTLSDIGLSIAVGNIRCVTAETAPGLLRLDSLCDMNNRLIEPIIGSYSLRQNTPNPFSRITSINFSLGLDGRTTLEVLDAGGNRVALLMDQYLLPGYYSVTWDARGMPDGQYLARITSGTWSSTVRMMLIQ